MKGIESITQKIHRSDCAVYNEPAYPKGKCNCEGIPDMGKESIDNLWQVKKIALSVMRMTADSSCDNFDEEMDKIIELTNSVLLKGAAEWAVLYQGKEVKK